MTALLDFKQEYDQLIEEFEQGVSKAARKITLKEILQAIPTDPFRNPRRPRLDASSELEHFKDGDFIELGVLYLTSHNHPTYKLRLTRQNAELYYGEDRDPIRTFSKTTASRIYAQWLSIIQKAIEQIPPLPF